MSTVTSREIRLRRRPAGETTAEDFQLAQVEVPMPALGEIQVRNHWMSVDPYMRGRMKDGKSYITAFEVGKALHGGAIGEVVASKHPEFEVGQLVLSSLGWREVFNASAADLQKVETHGLPLQALLGVAGMTGLTAYLGLLRFAELKQGDIVFVSAAAGAVGQIVCQIAKLRGHTVIGSAGGPDKVAYLRRLGVDHVIDYKNEDLAEALRRAAPDGIDVYFDNVGGSHLDAALLAARPFARFVLCGMISEYDVGRDRDGVRNLFAAVTKDLSLRGFIVSRHSAERPAFLRDMTRWIAEGKITWKETVETGIENAPAAFLKLFRGENLGKMLVKL